MKFLFVFACVVVAANAKLSKEFVEKFMEKMQQVGEKCMGETGASEADIAELMAHKVPDTHEGKCMIFCFHKHFNVQKDDGSLDPEGSMQAMQPLKDEDPELFTKIVSVFSPCFANAVIDADPCITAGTLASCGRAEAEKQGLTSEIFEF